MYITSRKLCSVLGPAALALGRPLPVVRRASSHAFIRQANAHRSMQSRSSNNSEGPSTPSDHHRQPVGAAIVVTSMGALGYWIYTRRKPRKSRFSAQPLSKDKISSPLELEPGRTTDVSRLIVTYEGVGKNGEVVQVQLGVKDSLVEKEFGLVGNRGSTFVAPVDADPRSSEEEEATDSHIGVALSAGLEEDLEMPLNSSVDSDEARRRRSRSASGSLSGMILHRVRDSISEASREARFGFDIDSEAGALGLEDEIGRSAATASISTSRPSWLARTFGRLRQLSFRSPPKESFLDTADYLVPEAVPTPNPPRKLHLVPFPRDSPPATPTSAAPLWPQTQLYSRSPVLPLHIEPFRVTYDSTVAALEQRPERPRHQSLAIPPHIRPRLASKQSQSREMGTQYSYHDFAHASPSTSIPEPSTSRRRAQSAFSITESHSSSSHYGPTPPARSRQGSSNTTDGGHAEQPFAFVPPPLPPTPIRFKFATQATPPPASPASISSSFPLQFPSPSALTFPSYNPRSERPSIDSVSAALGRDRSDARVLAFVEERPSPHRASPVEGVASDTGSDDDIVNLITSTRSERRVSSVKAVEAATPPRSSIDGGPASSLRRIMDARARKRRELTGSISSTSAFTPGEISLPNTPPTTPRHHHHPQQPVNSISVPASPTSQSQSSFHTAQGTLHSRSSFGAPTVEDSADIFVVPPTPISRSRTSSNHEPLSKRMSLRYELALAASASVFDRRGSGSTIGSLGSGGTQEDGEGMEDYETKARRLRMSLLRKVEVRP